MRKAPDILGAVAAICLTLAIGMFIVAMMYRYAGVVL